WRDGDIRWLIDDPARNLEDAWSPLHTRDAVVLDVHQARTHATLLDLDSGLERAFPADGHTAIPLAPVGEDWIVERYSATQPADVMRGDISLTRLFERTALRWENLAPAEEFRWTSVDGLPIQGWLYRARGEARGSVVYVHGGPTAHSENALNVTVQFLAHAGFNVLDPNYRGSTGFSLQFQEAIKEDGWGGREQDDIRAGIEALVAQGIAASGKIGMVGTSYGGYSSWWGITHWPPEILQAAAPICGMTDLVVDYETTRPDLRPYSEEMLGGSPEEVPERYRERSPIHYVRNIRGRLLIVQGMQDPNVTSDNVRDVRTALDDAGVGYEVLAFEDEGHGISRPRNVRTLCLRLEKFFSEAFT
ncbi:MAG: S9 family peptidase, partial [Armatimonadetes bacterium]|nr:S9 family peptidase [Armatimonadota bacterium]